MPTVSFVGYEYGSKTITVEAKEGVGKCTDDGQDGISYYYTVLDPAKDNFEITFTGISIFVPK